MVGFQLILKHVINKQEKVNSFSVELLRWGLRATTGEET